MLLVMARKEAFQRTAERGSRAAIKGRPAAVGSLKRRRVERLIGFIFVGHVEHRQDRIEAHPFLCGLPLFRLQLPRGLTQPSSELLIAFGNSSNRCQSAEAITATNLFSIRFKAKLTRSMCFKLCGELWLSPIAANQPVMRGRCPSRWTARCRAVFVEWERCSFSSMHKKTARGLATRGRWDFRETFYLVSSRAAWAAARRATGTRNGEQLT